MDPALANRNLDPPNEPVVSRGLVPALLVNVALVGALAVAVNWDFGSDRAASSGVPPRAAAVSDANDTSRMGGAPTPPAEAPVPAWPTVAAAGAPSQPVEAPVKIASITPPPEPLPALPPRVVKQPEPPAPAKVAAHTPKPEAARAKPAEKRLQPSFDCAKAQSATERLICGDAELARLDRELGRVHAQAKRSTSDPQDFKRENDDEWRLREAVCRDKDCLREWYSHRKQQLEERIAQGR